MPNYKHLSQSERRRLALERKAQAMTHTHTTPITFTDATRYERPCPVQNVTFEVALDTHRDNIAMLCDVTAYMSSAELFALIERHNGTNFDATSALRELCSKGEVKMDKSVKKSAFPDGWTPTERDLRVPEKEMSDTDKEVDLRKFRNASKKVSYHPFANAYKRDVICNSSVYKTSGVQPVHIERSLALNNRDNMIFVSESEMSTLYGADKAKDYMTAVKRGWAMRKDYMRIIPSDNAQGCVVYA